MRNFMSDEQFSQLCEHLKQECEFEELPEVVKVGKGVKVKTHGSLISQRDFKNRYAKYIFCILS